MLDKGPIVLAHATGKMRPNKNRASYRGALVVTDQRDALRRRARASCALARARARDALGFPRKAARRGASRAGQVSMSQAHRDLV